MKLKNCLGFLFYLHSLSLSPFSLTLALALPLSVLLSYPANGISGYFIFFPAVLRNFPTFFSPVLASPLRQAPQTHFKRFLGCGERKGYGGSVLYLCWVTVWAAIKEAAAAAAAAHSTLDARVDSARLEARVFDLNLAELCTATFTVSRATVSGQTGLPRVYHSNFHFEFFATFHF